MYFRSRHFIFVNGTGTNFCDVWFLLKINWRPLPLQWRHNGHDGISNHQPHDCLLNRLFRRRSKKTSNSALPVFVRGSHWSAVKSPHKGPLTWKMFTFYDAIMASVVWSCHSILDWYCQSVSMNQQSVNFSRVIHLSSSLSEAKHAPVKGRWWMLIDRFANWLFWLKPFINNWEDLLYEVCGGIINTPFPTGLS